MKKKILLFALVLVAAVSWPLIERRYEKKKFARGGISYWIHHTISLALPDSVWRAQREGLLKKPCPSDRVNYCCKLDTPFTIPVEAHTISEFYQENKRRKAWWYVYDLYEHLRYFPQETKFLCRFGDITYVPDAPMFVKSRPIDGDNRNSVLINLDKGRHFIFVKDKKRFQAKKNKLVWRGAPLQEWRKDLVKRFEGHPLCDVKGDGYMSVKEQLEFKFVLSLEGSDVASNLKWILSSNSLCFAPKHKYETWFMEGRLIPNYHYVLIKDDYSDLIEKIEYYSEHTDEALAIIAHAHEHVAQFQDLELEKLIALSVVKQYLRYVHAPTK